MRRLRIIGAALGVVFATTAFVGLPFLSHSPSAPVDPTPLEPYAGPVRHTLPDDDPKPLPAFVNKGLVWLAQAQFENGGWGAGSHSRQDIHDPRAVQIDPATTAFSAMAFLRTGNTLTDGPYHATVGKALTYLLDLVEAYPEEGARISDIAGTQPQVKLGQHVDVAMVAQFFTQALPHTRYDKALRDRVAEALEVCVSKLTRAQDTDGSWNSSGGWAGVLQSAMANNALEMAKDAGLDIDQEALKRSRQYQKDNLDETSGEVRTESAAGVSLYSIASNQRATAQEAREAKDKIAEGLRDGKLDLPADTSLDESVVTEDNLMVIGYEEEDARRLADAYRKNKAASRMVRNDDVLAGFGNNGGEEYLSYMMTSESLATTGSEDWETWYEKMNTRLSKVQNPDGSWSGHHCITSPVFCTAAVILTMTADRAA
ncbi:MAG: terpene cyclase/mutase family protein [Bacteroidetes bacterium]|nr:terpene cyclase/mutase family protein [Bacteroidota bacterium]